MIKDRLLHAFAHCIRLLAQLLHLSIIFPWKRWNGESVAPVISYNYCRWSKSSREQIVHVRLGIGYFSIMQLYLTALHVE